MLELRCCEGVTRDDGYFVQLDGTGQDITSNYAESEDGSWEVGNISPYYESEEYAQKAIDKVGKERIIKAISTVAGIKE